MLCCQHATLNTVPEIGVLCCICVEVWRQRSFIGASIAQWPISQGSKSKTLPAELQALLPAEQLSAPRTVALHCWAWPIHWLIYVPVTRITHNVDLYIYILVCWARLRMVEFMWKPKIQGLESCKAAVTMRWSHYLESVQCDHFNVYSCKIAKSCPRPFSPSNRPGSSMLRMSWLTSRPVRWSMLQALPEQRVKQPRRAYRGGISFKPGRERGRERYCSCNMINML